MPQKKRLLALLVGINTYTLQSNLEAAVSDVRRIDTYLQGFTAHNMQYEPTILTDAAADYDSVIATFEELTRQAGPDDLFLFYYSGHGGQEKTDPSWQFEESDQLLEGLALHDSGEGGKPMLIDKDLRYLIAQLAKKGCDILTIFDCCSSGDNTRSLESTLLPRLSNKAPVRKWGDFYFVQKLGLTPQQIATTGLDSRLPMGRHTHIAACQDYELAYEQGRTGIFTDKLLAILKETGGDISYMALQRRVKNAIRRGGVNAVQTPQIAVLKEFPKDAYRTFLTDTVAERPRAANVVYNEHDQRWILDRGGMHGVVVAEDDADAQVMIPLGYKKVVNARVTEVGSATSTVVFDPAAEKLLPRGRTSFSAYIPGLLSHPIKVAKIGAAEGVAVIEQQAAIDAEGLKQAGIFWVADLADADFAIQAGNHVLSIVTPGETRPLVLQHKGYSAASAQAVFNDLRKATRWYFAKKLNNPVQSLPQKLVDVTISHQGTAIRPNAEGIIELHYPDSSSPLPKTSIKIDFRNDSGQKLYFAALYLSPQFGVDPRLLRPEVQQKADQASLSAFGGREIPLKMERYIRQYNWPYQTFWIQMIGDTTHFDPKLYQQDALEEPIPDPRSGFTAKGALDFSAFEPLETDTWATQLIEVRVVNPFYQAES